MTHGVSEPAAAAVDVVIVNWNSGDLLRGCLAALAASSIASSLRAVVVDNASRDGSEDGLAADGLLQLDILRNPENRGFGAACNQGAATGEAPFLLFLNPDTRIRPDTLEKTLAYLSVEAGAGVVGVRLVDDTGATQRTCARQPTLLRLLAQNAGLDRLLPRLIAPHFMLDWDHQDTRAVDQVMGAFLLIRRSLFESVDGFDERYFVYYEDVDLCLSARRAGARVVHFAGTEAWHRGGGTTDQVKDRRLFYMMRSQVLYVAKWYGRGAACLALAFALGVQVPVRVLRSLASGQPSGAVQALRGGWFLAKDLPRITRAARLRAAGSTDR